MSQDAASTSSVETFHGSCHCGRVRFEVDLDLAAGTSGKCNCSYCAKQRWWSMTVKPEALRVTAGNDSVRDYQFGTNSIHHHFCGTCGAHPFGRGFVPEIGGAFASVNLACLDDLPPARLAKLPVRYFNGRDNRWLETPDEIRHL